MVGLDRSNGDFGRSGRSAGLTAMRGAARGLGEGVDLVAQVDLFSAAPYEVSRTKNLLTVSMH